MEATVKAVSELKSNMANSAKLTVGIFLFRTGFSLLHLPDTSKDIGFNVNHWVHDLMSLALAMAVLVLGTSVISTLQVPTY